MQIRWLNQALQNLDDEAEYIAQDDPVAARRVVQRIVELSTCYPEIPLQATQAGYTARVNWWCLIPAISYLTVFVLACSASRFLEFFTPHASHPSAGSS